LNIVQSNSGYSDGTLFIGNIIAGSNKTIDCGVRRHFLQTTKYWLGEIVQSFVTVTDFVL